MDPTAELRRMLEAIKDGDPAIVEHAAINLAWLAKAGHLPPPADLARLCAELAPKLARALAILRGPMAQASPADGPTPPADHRPGWPYTPVEDRPADIIPDRRK